MTWIPVTERLPEPWDEEVLVWDYEDQAAACLDDPQGNVRGYAAWSLVMMESTKRLPEVINLASASENILSVRGKGPAQIAIAQFRKAFDQARTSLARLKSQQ